MVVEGEQVKASMTTASATSANIAARKQDDTMVLVGTSSVGPNHAESEVDRRLSDCGDPGDLFIIDQLQLGMKYDAGITSLTHTQGNGILYPFSLGEKLSRITEPHPWYTADRGYSSPWGRAVVPMEMICVLSQKVGDTFPVRSPAVGLFLDLEIRLHAGPIFVDEDYALTREVVGLSQSRRTESFWSRTTISQVDTGQRVAEVLLHSGYFKASYPGYPDQQG
jgi:hypothetical protein